MSKIRVDHTNRRYGKLVAKHIVGRTSIMNRLNRGMSPEEAISTPPKRPGNKNNH